MNNRILSRCVLMATLSALSTSAFAATGNNVNRDLNRVGNRVEQRFDNRGDRINQRLDTRGSNINDRLDMRSQRAETNGHDARAAKLDREGNMVDRKLDRRGNQIDRKL